MHADPRWTGGWRWLTVLIGIGLLAALARHQALDVGLMSDDFAQHGMLVGLYPGQGYVPFDLYAFFRDDPQLLAAHVEAGTVPWWTEPGLHGTVLRPLSSALLSLDHALVPFDRPNAAWAWHLHSLAWLVALVVAAGLALGRILPAWIAVLALVLLGCEAGVATPVAWLANRCVLVSATFGCLAVWVHVGWRTLERSPLRRRGSIAAEVALVCLSLAAGEYGLACVAYLLAYELLGAPAASVRARALACLPALAPTLVWLISHRALGYGSSGSAVYVDPFTAPIAWLELATTRVPRLLTAAFWSLPADTGDLVRRFGTSWFVWDLLGDPGATANHAGYERAHLIVCGVLLVLAALVVWLLRHHLHDDERRALRWLTAGAVLGLVPLSVAPAHSRLLIPAQLGACALVAAMGVATIRALTGARPYRVASICCVPLTAALVYGHTVSELQWSRVYLAGLTNMNRTIEAAFDRGDVPAAEFGGRDVIVLNAISQTVALHGHYLLNARGQPTPRSWRSLAMAEFPIIARRTGKRSLELSAVQGGWLRSGAELFFRRDGRTLPAGTAFEIPGLSVQINADVEGYPTRVTFGFPASLDDPRYLFLISTPQGLRRWQVPKRGDRAVVPIPALPLVYPHE
ncbi:hypothetical protein [Enhygromyxa salina]|uniref:Glycosyltransferase RgtA/B/C/D-like domain-containing protein n=1 Tax=Enhygromyxa salina TaxID=215803 RepID=A0A2S9YMZ7_9BACT|nr:hypothetical protein [Enhygromyxa salina]PRQ06439.1 hypothetical protein ENSA7_37580 [Enhygromyxa salina]